MAVRCDSSAGRLRNEHSGYDLLNFAASHLPIGIVSERGVTLQGFWDCDFFDM